MTGTADSGRCQRTLNNAVALGYENLNDHDLLRKDSSLALLVGKHDLSGSSTLNRLELNTLGSAAANRKSADAKIEFSGARK